MMVRRNNSEYHEGRKARRGGLALKDCPYSASPNPDSRQARWLLGWGDQDAAMPRELLDAIEETLRLARYDSVVRDGSTLFVSDNGETVRLTAS